MDNGAKAIRRRRECVEREEGRQESGRPIEELEDRERLVWLGERLEGRSPQLLGKQVWVWQQGECRGKQPWWVVRRREELHWKSL